MTARAISFLLTLAYPIAVFLSLRYWSLNGLGLVLLGLGLLRILLPGESGRLAGWLGGALLIAVAGIVLWTGLESPARFYPVFVNLSLLSWFGWSLVRPPTVIERMARLTDPELPDYAVAYTRKVTWTWCLFFMANSMAAAYTAFFSTLEIWTLYNGLVAYILMGLLFAAEYLVRRRVRRRHERLS